MSKSNLFIHLDINKLKTYFQPALTDSFANRTVLTSKWHCIWLSVLKLCELLLKNVGCVSKFTLNKDKVVGFRNPLTFKIITVDYLVSDIDRDFKDINRKKNRLTSGSDFTGYTNV